MTGSESVEIVAALAYIPVVFAATAVVARIAAAAVLVVIVKVGTLCLAASPADWFLVPGLIVLKTLSRKDAISRLLVSTELGGPPVQGLLAVGSVFEGPAALPAGSATAPAVAIVVMASVCRWVAAIFASGVVVEPVAATFAVASSVAAATYWSLALVAA